jgi:hypothetical protein
VSRHAKGGSISVERNCSWGSALAIDARMPPQSFARFHAGAAPSGPSAARGPLKSATGAPGCHGGRSPGLPGTLTNGGRT